MRFASFFIGLASLVQGCSASQVNSSSTRASVQEAEFLAGETQTFVRAAEIAWVRCPPTLPAGCEMAVLEGDPKQEMLFTVRFRMQEPFDMKAHWHPRNERVTVLEGRVGVGFGDAIDREAANWFGPGDYYVNAKGAHHFVVTDGPALLQITGIGPWEVHYVR